MRTYLTMVLCFSCFVIPSMLMAQATWELAWSDEFDYTGLPDPARWSYDVGGNGWGNLEEQYYTENREENARVDGDHLIIEARKESWGGRSYTSARLVTKEKGDWTYGRIEVRAQLPFGVGTWPAIWMLPTNSPYGNGGWPDTGEIDIMEYVGYDPGFIHGTIHTDIYNHLSNSQRRGSIPISEASDAFHVYGLEWTPQKLEFSVDGTVYWTYSKDQNTWQGWPFDQDFHLILNIAIGGTWGGFRGIDDNIFPQTMLVDYVRVYQNIGIPEVSLEIPLNVEVGGTAAFSGTSSDTDGQVQTIELYQGDGLVATIRDATAQWSTSIDGVSEGCYFLRAVAIDDGGWRGESEMIPLNVGSSCMNNSPYLLRPHPISERIEAEYFDLGGPGVAYRDLTRTNDGNIIRLDEGVDLYATTDGTGYHVGNTTRREWVSYTVHVDQAGIYDLRVRLESQTDIVSFSVEFDGVDKTGPFEFQNQRNQFQTVRVNREEGLTLEEGTQVMKLNIGRGIPNINWLQFRLRSPVHREELPENSQTRLLRNYPNPFTHHTTINYQVGRPGPVLLELYNALGQRVRTLINNYHQAGEYSAILSGEGLSTGIYFYKLTADVTAHQILQYLGP